MGCARHRPADGRQPPVTTAPDLRTDDQASAAPIRVLVADDQAMVRAGFRMIIDSQPDLSVVGEADNGRSAVELAQRIRPDVCILDIRMPTLDGLAATRMLAGPMCRVR